jgi:class 3 adenylate cyclase
VTAEQRKTVTIVFTDVTGSTALGENLDPEAVRRVMERYFDAMREVVERHGGQVEKFIGDAVMAVFGIPRTNEDDALRACRAADEMRQRLEVLNKELERDLGVSIRTRTGVNTGEVVAGTGQTLVTGDVANVAARLEQAATPGEILMGELTYSLVRNAVDAEPVSALDLKGKTEPVPALKLVRVIQGVAGHTRRMDSPMVGREREARLLRDAYESAVAGGTCQLFTLLGAAGVGKSRLVQEFIAGVENATVLQGRCLPYGDGITFWPVLEVVKAAAELDDFDAADVVETKICSLLE